MIRHTFVAVSKKELHNKGIDMSYIYAVLKVSGSDQKEVICMVEIKKETICVAWNTDWHDGKGRQ